MEVVTSPNRDPTLDSTYSTASTAAKPDDRPESNGIEQKHAESRMHDIESQATRGWGDIA
jgi:hypothetical protein